MAVFLARMVMPRSRSSAFESITRSTWCSLDRKVPLCCSMASTSVVLPWSTCAIIAILRILELKRILPDLLSTTTLLCGNEINEGSPANEQEEAPAISVAFRFGTVYQPSGSSGATLRSTVAAAIPLYPAEEFHERPERNGLL